MLGRVFLVVRSGNSSTFLFCLYILEKRIFKSLAQTPASPVPELPLDFGV